MKKFTLLLLAMAAVLAAMAQKNVSWTYSSHALPGGNVELVFSARIADGFHLYSPYNPKGASMPLTITFADTACFSTSGQIIEERQPEERYEDIFGVTEKFFSGQADFKVVIAPKTSALFSVAGKIRGQACNNLSVCTMVSETFSIKVDPPEAKAEEPKPETGKSETAGKTEAGPGKPEKAAESGNAGLKPEKAEETSEAAIKTEAAEETSENPGKPETPEASDSAGMLGGNLFSYSANDASPKYQAADSCCGNGSGGLWGAFLLAFLAGLAAIFTPCVFPMIPMTVSYFLKDKDGHGKRNAIVYGLSIIALYTLPVALLILLSALIGGEGFTAGVFNALSTHWLPNVIFFVIFFIFALSFLGMFDIEMPSWLINRAEKRGDKGGIAGIFFLAFVLVLVSFSCTGPIVGSVLVESASGNNFMKPVIAILGFSTAFALPFALLALFPDMMKKLPKSGGWMSTLKAVLGFVELALGLKFLSVADQTYHWHILDRETYLSIWIAIGLLLALYLLGKIKLPMDSDTPFIKVPRLVLAIIALSFTLYMIPGLWGAPLKALSGYIPPITTQDMVLGQPEQGSAAAPEYRAQLCGIPKYSDILKLPHGMASYFSYDEARQCARSQNKPLLLIFTGHGCVNCRKMEESVWSQPMVREMMQRDFVMCSLYTDDRTPAAGGSQTIGEENTELQISQFSINAQPYYVIMDAACPGKPLLEPQGYNPDPASFMEYLRAGVSEYTKKR